MGREIIYFSNMDIIADGKVVETISNYSGQLFERLFYSNKKSYSAENRRFANYGSRLPRLL